MKNFLKVVAALAAVAGAVAVVVRYGDKLLSKLKSCPCNCCDDAPVAEEAPVEAPETPEEAPVPETSVENEAPVEAPAEEAPSGEPITPEDFVD